jgi:sterol desaturase/sphingolipid hydroxylase (fatty acid hydroxylase superfamily)
MDTQHFIAYGIFFVVVALESVLSFRRNIDLYQGRDFFNNIVLGLFTTILMIIGKGTFLAFFALCNRVAPFDIGMTWWSWIILFLVNDIIFYWFHRFSHVIRIFWAFHVAHHSSENYNFSTAVRNNFLIQTFRYMAWAPLALIGFDPVAIILMDSIAYFYQLFVHTQLIRNMGFFEWFLNTPSHHRVHHGSNTEYIDKNYGAILIIWDKLFGTFRKEGEPVRFGITKNIDPQNVPNILFHEFISIGKDVGRSGSLSNALGYIFGHPGWSHNKTLLK